jgi:hypothetical protein
MTQAVRHYCDSCGRSVYNVEIDGKRVPLVFYMVVGQPPDTGPVIGLNDPGIKVPQFVRELMATPTARMELCMECLAIALNLPLVEGPQPETPRSTVDSTPGVARARPGDVVPPPDIGEVEVNVVRKAPVLAALPGGGQGRER